MITDALGTTYPNGETTPLISARLSFWESRYVAGF